MRRNRRHPLFGFALSLLVAGAGVIGPMAASAQTPTAEQLKMFQELPPEQRDAILRQLGQGANTTTPIGGSTTGTTGTASQVLLQQPGLAKADAEEAARRTEDEARKRNARIKGGEVLLLELVLPDRPLNAPARGPALEKSLVDLRDRVIKRNPYELSPFGVLQLPGFEPIPLAGLTAKEAQERLALDPNLREFSVAVTLLKVEPQGIQALKPYGYEIFKDAANAVVPGTDIPVPDDYKLGPGDTVGAQLYGQQSQLLSLPVSREGSISFPALGPIDVGGMSFGAARSMIEARVKKQLIGTQVRVTLTSLRSARVLVLGDAERPGSYVVSGLATATMALFASGGVKPIGSLRRIEIRRGGSLIRKLDLYDVLLKGNTENDVHLQTGDAVFVPPVGTVVTVDGAVRRPAIYELTNNQTMGELIQIAGGLDSAADESMVTLERINRSHDREITRVDVREKDVRELVLQDGDVVRVGSVPPVVDNGIVVEGYVHAPTTVAYRPGIRLSEVLSSPDMLLPRVDLHYILVRREAQDRGRVNVFSADLSAALLRRGSDADIALSPRDRLHVFDLSSSRQQIVQPLLEEMSRQARPTDPAGIAEITGRVNSPGVYPLETGMRVSDLLRAGGGLQDSAYALTAELTRYEVVSGSRRESELRTVDIAAIEHGDPGADIPIRPYDVLAIHEIPDWGRLENVSLRGEVRFPGVYRIGHGETLHGLILRAGGLTSLAFPEGAVFTRDELKKREREQIDRLADRMQADIATLSLQASQTNPAAGESIAAGRSLLDQLRGSKPVGRLVIDLRKIASLAGTGDADVTLRDGDELIVPRVTQEVTVLGEVQSPTSLLYRTGMRRDDAVEMSGGVTARADRARIYVVRADGSVVANPTRWFGSRSTEIHAGDTVVVPFDAEKMRPLPMWTAITTIIYNLAIAATAVGRL